VSRVATLPCPSGLRRSVRRALDVVTSSIHVTVLGAKTCLLVAAARSGDNCKLYYWKVAPEGTTLYMRSGNLEMLNSTNATACPPSEP
jgi:hypothetical protein